ncbi:putative membrane protein [Hasllibacter halocynthiae]|uniref:Putative membrane protein n=1 Tax=Hasllibacter halocynthiae TaxID=595589 RepID=A0A2T0WZ83_9RHOB|nr:DUF2254 domain-containing protein [Hasllibacter halocynthiae]PRY92008.1 putative membrane protein [Hasllibacter halocynthiae]
MSGRRAVRRLRLAAADLRRAVWILPALAMLGGTVTAAVTAASDIAPPKNLPASMGGLLTTSGPAGARDLVQTVASTSLTVATFVFSVTIVALQVAASQYSPRVPQQVIRDRGTQVVMSLFIFSFVYSLATVRTIRGDEGIVPTLSVSVAFLLALMTVGGFVYFINHIVQAMRVEHILRTLEHTTLGAVRSCFRRQIPGDPGPSAAPPGARTVPAMGGGVVEMIHERELFELAAEEGIGIELLPMIGEQLVAGTPVARIWAVRAGGEPDAARVARGVMASLTVGPARPLTRDPTFGLTQIVDIALRASSPAINDPTTTRGAIRSAEVVLCELALCTLGRRTIRDEKGRARLIVPGPGFADYLDLVVSPIRLAAADDPSVVRRLVRMLWQLGWSAQDREVLRCARDQAGELAAHLREAMTLDQDRRRALAEITELRRHLDERARTLGAEGAAA